MRPMLTVKTKNVASESQTQVCFGVKISSRKYDDNHTKTCAHCFKTEKKNKQLKSGSYSIYVKNSLFMMTLK